MIQKGTEDMSLFNWGRSKDPAANWPVGEDAKPVRPVLLCDQTGLSMDCDVLINMLGAYGVPVMKKYPGDGSFGKVMLGVPGYGVELYVPETMLEMAQDLISEDAAIEEEEL